MYKFDFHQTPDDLRPYIALIICITASCASSYAQTNNADHHVIANSGDVYDDGVNQLSFTIGETVIQTVGSKTSFLTQGFQQSAFIISTVEELMPFNYQVKAYPNPAGEFVNLESDKAFDMQIRVLDLNGREVIQTETREKLTQLNFGGLPNAAYLLHVSDQSGVLIKTFQIQKVQ